MYKISEQNVNPKVLSVAKSCHYNENFKKWQKILYRQMAAPHMFIYARSEQCDLGPIYTITNTQRIRIYPGKLKFIRVKISLDRGCFKGKHAKENQTLSRFLLLRIYPDSSVYTSANTERIQICPVML